jgi:hypothetical protein
MEKTQERKEDKEMEEIEIGIKACSIEKLLDIISKYPKSAIEDATLYLIKNHQLNPLSLISHPHTTDVPKPSVPRSISQPVSPPLSLSSEMSSEIEEEINEIIKGIKIIPNEVLGGGWKNMTAVFMDMLKKNPDIVAEHSHCSLFPARKVLSQLGKHLICYVPRFRKDGKPNWNMIFYNHVNNPTILDLLFCLYILHYPKK